MCNRPARPTRPPHVQQSIRSSNSNVVIRSYRSSLINVSARKMDSMRSLNTSLPKSHNSRSAPPEELLQAFRSAALSVTNLYKAAATDQSNSRQEGYQDALDDLLVLLDNENIGLQDGEGWRIRQWINDRHERASAGGQQQESEDEAVESGKRPRSSSPFDTREPTDDILTRTRSYSQPPANPEPGAEPKEEQAHPPMFRFSANQSPEVPMQSESTSISQQNDSHAMSSPQTVRVGIVPRGSRTPQRQRGIKSSSREPMYITGTKRKFQVPDFFDFSNMNFGSDKPGGGPSKRGKYA